MAGNNRIIAPPGFGGDGGETPPPIKPMQNRLEDLDRYWDSNPRKAKVELIAALHLISNLCAHYARTFEQQDSKISMMQKRIDALESQE